MLVPQVFVCSTYIDLEGICNDLFKFIEEYGFEPRVEMKGGYPFDYDKEIANSNIDNIRDSDIYLLIIGGRCLADPTLDLNEISRKMKVYNRKLIREYRYALEKGLQTYIFIDSKVMTEYNIFKSVKDCNMKFKYVDNINIFTLIDQIFSTFPPRSVREFSTVNDIAEWLRPQWAAFVKLALLEGKKNTTADTQRKSRINCYKLFWYRTNNKFSISKLSEMSSVSKNIIQRLESPVIKHKHGKKVFPETTDSMIGLLALALNVSCKDLQTGQEDDYSYQYVEYYHRNKSKRHFRKTKGNQLAIFPTKVIVFDFDGTLTKPKNNQLSTWEKIWEKLGYIENQCVDHHARFSNGEITHEQWCKITFDAFRERNLSLHQLYEIADDIELIDGCKEVLNLLKNSGISLHLLSGSIDKIIHRVLGNLVSHFTTTKCNQMTFGADGFINNIIGTKFDFRGKADYLSHLMKIEDVRSTEVLYIGNSLNDRWAYESGARTLCVNPHLIDPDKKKQWTNQIRHMKNLNEILRFISFPPLKPFQLQTVEKMSNLPITNKRFDVALSFADADRLHASQLADRLIRYGFRVFFDDYRLEELWGSDLAIELAKIYSDQSEYCIIFTSKNYKDSIWTKYELKNALSYSIINKKDYILPVRVDNTEIEGIPKTIGFLDLSKHSIENIAKIFLKKVKDKERAADLDLNR